jgi:hypothetical protein
MKFKTLLAASIAAIGCCGAIAGTMEGGGFNRSMQHTNHRLGGRSVANEETTTDLLLR